MMNISSRRNELVNRIRNAAVSGRFSDTLTMEVFEYQYENNILYHQFCTLLHRTPNKVSSIEHIPFLPIEFFKTHKILTGIHEPKLFFQSSGTTGFNRSRHWISDSELYNFCSKANFSSVYGPLTDYSIFALLPSYLEQSNSSLVFMVEHFIKQSDSTFGGFFMHNHQQLLESMLEAAKTFNTKILLLGVTFALLDFAEFAKGQFPDNVIVMETGGMKGRRKEMLRQELHSKLCNDLCVSTIHSEYGMTELQSQAYSTGNELFTSGGTMKILIRDTNDPLSIEKPNRTGGINVIDLVNIDSCSFIATQDLGKIHLNGQFEILGRFDHSDIRGCNLLAL